MENWQMFGKAKDIEKKPSVLKEYIVPLGSLFLASLALFSQNTPPLWVSIAIAVFVAIVFLFLVVPVLVPIWKQWRKSNEHGKSEKYYLPKLIGALRKFQPMLDSHRADTIWEVWQSAAREVEAQQFVRPNYSHFYTLSRWLEHLNKTANAASPRSSKFIATEMSSWVQQYASFCRDAYSQFESLLRDNKLHATRLREIRQNWNHVRDGHNQAVSDWLALCAEINESFGQDICAIHCETLKPLE